MTRRFSPKLRKPQLQAITSFIPKVRIIQPLPPAHFEREAGKVSGRGKGLKLEGLYKCCIQSILLVRTAHKNVKQVKRAGERKKKERKTAFITILQNFLSLSLKAFI